MNKKYKVVNVYSGYGEMSINRGIDEVVGNSLKEVCIELLEEKKDSSIENDEDLSYFEEFVNMWFVKDKLGSIGDGEEGYDLIIEEGNEWYDKVDNYDNWSEEEWDKWVKFNDKFKWNEEGKI